MFITNGGGEMERERAERLRRILKTKDIKEEDIILSHTPYKEYVEEYKEKRIMVIGRNPEGDIEIMKHYGYKNVVTLEEMVEKMPYAIPYSGGGGQGRGYIPIEKLKEQEKIHAIFILQNPIDWNEATQIMCDLVQGNGRMIQEKNQTETIPVYMCNPDMVYGGQFNIPRLTQGAFVEGYKAIFKRLYPKKQCNIIACGKPTDITFKYATERLKTEEPKDVWMIEDNPEALRGAVKAGWNTILVKTGVYKQGITQLDYQPTFI
eukprot:CAMPEP_0117428878 /NCGR_PEP_ID=MMETSP0758-20121206/8490_1 /TAXON_ID=63605 /ORGANISM="Percolomonas cosmopolitus, Strain AE-1 (ATCC 50343)" /LENGTH=262 /DNA_ID=CAMNT_0005215483 /DNA_START=1 /DNA_END=786 /DNA_ORIENTATION=-